jgi:hypothetical protein
MPFSNPIVAGETLVRTAIQSEGFVLDTTGWRIERDGDASFTSARITNGVYAFGITAAGNIIGANVPPKYRQCSSSTNNSSSSSYIAPTGFQPFSLQAGTRYRIDYYLVGSGAASIKSRLAYSAGVDRATSLIEKLSSAGSDAAFSSTSTAFPHDYTLVAGLLRLTAFIQPSQDGDLQYLFASNTSGTNVTIGASSWGVLTPLQF